MADRSQVRRALHVSYAAAAWSAVSGAAAIAVGIAAASTALVGTGADVAADMVSSLVLVWRFRSELHGHHTTTRAEERAEQIAAAALILVATGITTVAVLRLASGSEAETSLASILVAATAAVVLPAFAITKYRIAARVPSPALRMDGHITLVGAVMAVITLAGLAATSTLGWSWADPCAALLVAGLAINVGTDTLRATRATPPAAEDLPSEPVLDSTTPD